MNREGLCQARVVSGHINRRLHGSLWGDLKQAWRYALEAQACVVDGPLKASATSFFLCLDGRPLDPFPSIFPSIIPSKTLLQSSPNLSTCPRYFNFLCFTKFSNDFSHIYSSAFIDCLALCCAHDVLRIFPWHFISNALFPMFSLQSVSFIISNEKRVREKEIYFTFTLSFPVCEYWYIWNADVLFCFREMISVNSFASVENHTCHNNQPEGTWE